jgi:hypothetical protein
MLMEEAEKSECTIGGLRSDEQASTNTISLA